MQTKNFILFAKKEMFFGLEEKAWIFIVLPTVIVYPFSLFLALGFLIPSYIFMLIYTARDKERVSILLKSLSIKDKRYVF